MSVVRWVVAWNQWIYEKNCTGVHCDLELQRIPQPERSIMALLGDLGVS